MLYYKSFGFHVFSFTPCVHMFQYVVLCYLCADNPSLVRASSWSPIPTYVLTASWPLFKACHHNHWSVHLLSNCRQMSKYITERMVSVTLNQRAIHIHFHLYPWKVMLNVLFRRGSQRYHCTDGRGVKWLSVCHGAARGKYTSQWCRNRCALFFSGCNQQWHVLRARADCVLPVCVGTESSVYGSHRVLCGCERLQSDTGNSAPLHSELRRWHLRCFDLICIGIVVLLF